MRKYFVKYHGFANVYTLGYAETVEEENQATKRGFDRITRKEAESLCARENQRRKDNPAFSYFADNVILPIGYDDDWRNDRNLMLRGYIAERKNKP